MANSYIPQPGSLVASTAIDLRARIARGSLSARNVAEAFVQRIADIEPQIGAFAWHDPAHVLAQADALDAWARAGRALGPLHGVPVGIKDIIDTRGIPTEYGCKATAGHVPSADASIVERLYAAGAIIIGKTVTTELAFMHPGATRNPLNIHHSPGGSSSGSAAGVAAGMMPLAVGTQTGGSVTRPASFCGIIGFKPSFGLLSRRGVLPQSHSLDTLGVFARDLDDAALIVDVLAGSERGEPATRGAAPGVLARAQPGPHRVLNLALIRLPDVDEAHFDTLRAALGDLPEEQVRITECALPERFARISALRARINFAEMAHHYAWIEARGAELLSGTIREAIEAGKAVSAGDYMDALNGIASAQAELLQVFGDYDAILSTATAGPAPKGLHSTGTAICNGLWTYLGAPAVNMPVGVATEGGLRHGVQVTAPAGRDATVLSVASQLRALLMPG